MFNSWYLTYQPMRLTLNNHNFFVPFSNFTAQSSSLTSLASTLSDGLNDTTKNRTADPHNSTKFDSVNNSVLSVQDLESNLNDVSARWVHMVSNKIVQFFGNKQNQKI